MKKQFLLKSMMLLCMLLVGIGAWAETKTYQHVFNAKPSTGNSVTLNGVSWTVAATNLGSYNSGNYAGVQIGTKDKDGSITLTSNSVWNYQGASKITEVRLWLNLGGTSVTPTVKIGGKTASVSGTVTKNSTAGSDWTKTSKVTFTPTIDGNTGIVVINIATVKAGYICAMEIDCEEAAPVSVTGVSLDKSSAEIKVGKTATFTATIAPANATNKNVSWTSSNESVAIVDAGVVTAVAEGNTVITATTEDGNFTATCAVTVTPYVQSYANTYTSGTGLLSTTGGTSASSATVKWGNEQYDAIKAGVGSTAGEVKVVVPAGTKTLHVHIAGWNNEGNEVTVSGITPNKVLSITPDASVSGNSPFTLSNDPEDYDYFTIDTNNDEALTLSFTATRGNRFVLFGVNAEAISATTVYTVQSLTLAATDGTDYYATFSKANDVFIPEADDDIEYANTVYTVYAIGNLLELQEVTKSEGVDIDGTEYDGYYVPANSGVLIKTGFDKADRNIPYFDVENVAIDALTSDNALRPASQAKETDGSYKFYMLAYGDAELTPSTLGFYWGAANGAAFDSREGSAYLALPATSAKGFRFGDTETGIKSIEAVATSNAAYNLQGQRVNANQKGIVIVNGKKVLNK